MRAPQSPGAAEYSQARRSLPGADARASSDVEVRDAQRVLLDELAARFDDVAHQRREDLVRGDRVLDADLQQPARFGVDRRLPQLLGIHLAEALEALDRAALLRLLDQPRVRFVEIAHRMRASAAHDARARLDQALQRARDLRDR